MLSFHRKPVNNGVLSKLKHYFVKLLQAVMVNRTNTFSFVSLCSIIVDLKNQERIDKAKTFKEPQYWGLLNIYNIKSKLSNIVLKAM